MAIEIERKFLIKKDIWEKAAKDKSTYIKQGYLTTDPNLTIRVRLKDSQAFLTIKGKTKGASRPEYEYEIPQDDASELLDNFSTTSLEKTRYEIIVDGNLWEVDQFHGDNEGLIVAEIELQDENQKFSLPSWIDTEVTSDARYYNSNLVQNPYKHWVKQ
ncbi:MAG TPA: CYTH domain-containing protein [Cyclobacteriaceae bacterium]